LPELSVTDRDLAGLLVRMVELESEARAVAEQMPDERAVALVTVRQTVALKLALERWMLLRATRAALQE
jgi:hypothetical protein